MDLAKDLAFAIFLSEKWTLSLHNAVASTIY